MQSNILQQVFPLLPTLLTHKTTSQVIPKVKFHTTLMLVSFCQGKGKLNIGAHAIHSAGIVFFSWVCSHEEVNLPCFSSVGCISLLSVIQHLGYSLAKLVLHNVVNDVWLNLSQILAIHILRESVKLSTHIQGCYEQEWEHRNNFNLHKFYSHKDYTRE